MSDSPGFEVDGAIARFVGTEQADNPYSAELARVAAEGWSFGWRRADELLTRHINEGLTKLLAPAGETASDDCWVVPTIVLVDRVGTGLACASCSVDQERLVRHLCVPGVVNGVRFEYVARCPFQGRRPLVVVPMDEPLAEPEIES